MSRSGPLTIRLNPEDNVVVALVDLEPGNEIVTEEPDLSLYDKLME